MTEPFLTAEWSNLCIVTYAVEPGFIGRVIPSWLEPDTRDGHAFVSLVAFQFLKTKVLGISWPGFRSFPELNLRVYVKHGDKRGVYFIREFVPQPLVAWLAKSLYNEPYLAAPLTDAVTRFDEKIEARYQLAYGGRLNTIAVRGSKQSYRPAEDGPEHFFKEHSWGFGQTRTGRPLLYEVTHPVWDIYPLESLAVDLDWSVVYGPEWNFLQAASTYSVVFAKGSGISVFPAVPLVVNI
jgi:hypothetical protein